MKHTRIYNYEITGKSPEAVFRKSRRHAEKLMPGDGSLVMSTEVSETKSGKFKAICQAVIFPDQPVSIGGLS